MRAFELGRTFRLITLPFRPFQHLITVEEQLGCLKSIRKHLADDAGFDKSAYGSRYPGELIFTARKAIEAGEPLAGSGQM